jgi:hypothetical protein
MNTLVFEFVPSTDGEMEDLAEYLSELDEVGAVTVEDSETSRFAAETALVVIALGSAGLAAFTRLVDWLRDRRDCLLVVDARQEDLRVEERCDVVGRRGQVVIVTSGREQVVIERSDALNLQAIVTQAIEQSAEAAASLAKSLGGVAHIEARGDI